MAVKQGPDLVQRTRATAQERDVTFIVLHKDVAGAVTSVTSPIEQLDEAIDHGNRYDDAVDHGNRYLEAL